MPLFTPQTTIYLCDQTGIDEYNKPYYESDSAMVGWLMGKVKASFSDYSYQRADERQYCTINYDYYAALTCDIIMWRNAGHSNKWIIANITELEWVNPNTTRVYFKVDAWCTFCGTAQLQPCFVEREHVENDWTGNNPNFLAHGVPESFSATPERIVSETELSGPAGSEDNVIVILLADHRNLSISGKMDGGVYTGLNVYMTANEAEANEFLTELAVDGWANLQDVVGVYTVPQYVWAGSRFGDHVNIPAWLSPACSGKYNNSKVYSSPYVVFQIDTGAGDGAAYKPEFLNNPSDIQVFIEGYFSGGAGGAVAYPSGYNSPFATTQHSKIGKVATISQLPQGQVIGNNAVNQMSSNRQAATIHGLTSTLEGLLGAGLSAAINPYMGAYQAVNAIQQPLRTQVSLLNKNTEARTAAASVAGNKGTSANLAMGAGLWRFVGRWYVPTEPVMKSIDAYFDRFGYQVDTLKRPAISRPLWNYVKTKESHVAGSMPAVYREQIETMLNNGVTFWITSAREIGDFSTPEANKA